MVRPHLMVRCPLGQHTLPLMPISPDFWTKVLATAQALSKTVGDRLLQDFGHLQSRQKEDGSLVTPGDEWADRTLRDGILAAFPDHGLLSEESTHEFPATDWCWIIDPIDGTTNFAMGIPLWGISLGLLYRGTPVFGYVAMPPLGQNFHGYWPGDSGLEMPIGAFCNDLPIRSSQVSLKSSQVFSFCTRSISLLQQEPALSQRFPCKIRMLGASTYNLLCVANGAVMGGAEATPKVWDIAAIWPICQAAGVHWLSQTGVEPFPLTIGNDYGRHNYPTLALARADLQPIFEPLTAGLRR
jgi:myo-inositol-1(or 4)-monophosphatase